MREVKSETSARALKATHPRHNNPLGKRKLSYFCTMSLSQTNKQKCYKVWTWPRSETNKTLPAAGLKIKSVTVFTHTYTCRKNKTVGWSNPTRKYRLKKHTHTQPLKFKQYFISICMPHLKFLGDCSRLLLLGWIRGSLTVLSLKLFAKGY